MGRTLRLTENSHRKIEEREKFLKMHFLSKKLLDEQGAFLYNPKCIECMGL